ncbi:MAG: hypothetical protein AAF224_12710 [Pseudomonadota bacterium]
MTVRCLTIAGGGTAIGRAIMGMMGRQTADGRAKTAGYFALRAAGGFSCAAGGLSRAAAASAFVSIAALTTQAGATSASATSDSEMTRQAVRLDASATATETALPNLAPTIPPVVNGGKAWRIAKTEWAAADEAGYEAFVAAIGWSDCTSLESCLNNPANPYRDTDETEFYGDCADMAYTLRAYYAWKNALPFSYQSAMRTADRSGDDLRYSKAGNVVVGRRSVARSRAISAPGFIQRMPREVSTAMFRTHPETGGGASFDDFYPVRIDRDAVRPGILAYDIYGHVGIVYDVLEDGRILVIASHPDRSVTRTVYGANFMRSGPALGAGLKAWRPITLVGAQRTDDGFYLGGRIKGAKNADIPDFSMEQYLGNVPSPDGKWQNGEFRVGDRSLSYYDYVRRRLAAPDFKYNPVTEFRNGLETICGSIRDRKWAVDAARVARVHEKPHPGRLPPNIFGTYGEWEAYSTPSRDARLKVAFIELRRELQRLISDLENGAPGVAYDGEDLPRELWDTFVTEKEECRFTYWRTDNSRVRLNLAHVMDRLWDISFDPYHCPERRWGANGAELATCGDDETKTRWYAAQRFLRYQAERTYDVRMNFTLEELKHPALASAKDGGLGVEAPADADVRRYILSLAEPQGPFADDKTAPLPKPLAAAYREGDGVLLTPAEAAAFEERRFPEWHNKIRNIWAK